MAKQKKRRTKNPVARVLNDYNKPATHKDKTKYNRKNKVDKDLFSWLFDLVLISILMQLYYKCEETGGAWWPFDPVRQTFSFPSDTEYKIDGKRYSTDTKEFRRELLMACLRYKD